MNRYAYPDFKRPRVFINKFTIGDRITLQSPRTSEIYKGVIKSEKYYFNEKILLNALGVDVPVYDILWDDGKYDEHIGEKHLNHE